MPESIFERAHTIKFPFSTLNDPVIELPDHFKRSYDGHLNREWRTLAENPPYLKIPGVKRGDVTYTLFQTIVNPEAEKTIRDSALAKKYDNDDRDFYFGCALMNFYLHAASHIAGEREIKHWLYPRVENGNHVRWPIVHVVEGDDKRSALYREIFSKGAHSLPPIKDSDSSSSPRLQDRMLRDAKICPFSIVGMAVTRTGEELYMQGHPFQLYRLSHHYEPSSRDDD